MIIAMMLVMIIRVQGMYVVMLMISTLVRTTTGETYRYQTHKNNLERRN